MRSRVLVVLGVLAVPALIASSVAAQPASPAASEAPSASAPHLAAASAAPVAEPQGAAPQREPVVQPVVTLPPPAPPPPYAVWAPPQAATAPATPAVEKPPSGPRRDMSRDFWQLQIGSRTSWIASAGLDPFSTNDVFSQLTLSGTRAVYSQGSFSVAAGVLYETGGKDATARGARSELAVKRFGAVAEGRYHLARDVYALVKLVPQGLLTRATLQDDSSTGQLAQTAWQFGLDSTAGAAWNVPRTLGASSSAIELWVVGECGYGWTAGKRIELKPDVSDSDPNANARLDLGKLALNGVMMRLSAAVTF